MNLQEKRVLNILKPIIKKWKVIIHKFSDENENKDALYWYNERATLSTFAGAVWLSGGNVLEEFSATKIKSKIKKSKRTTSGRADLWFIYKKKEYIVEAKQLFPSMYRSVPPIPIKLKKKLEEACNDVNDFVPPASDKKYVRIGIVFLTPYFPESKERSGLMEKKIFDLRKELNQKYGYRLLAWLFLPSARKLQDTSNEPNLIYPGVAFVAKVARIKKREMLKK